MTPTPPSGIPVAIAGQLHRDDGQDAALRRQRRALVALIVWSVALPIGALGARPDGVVYLNGLAVELAVWPSLLSSPDILALATLPGTPTYELPESASTGAAAIRVQACRYDPRASLTTMPARGIGKPVTVAATVTRTVL